MGGGGNIARGARRPASTSVKIAAMPTVTVNGEALDEAALRRETAAVLALLSQQLPAEDPAALRQRAREWAEENLIEAALLRQAAASDPDLGGDAGAAASPLPLERLVQRVTAAAASPDAAEIAAHYAANRARFEEPERLRALHIVRNVDELHPEASARTAIEQARAALAGGKPFAEVADAMSDCPGNGGALPPFARGDMVPAFEDAVFALNPGETSGIFRTEFGFHIARLLAREPARARPLAEVRGEIAAELLRLRQQSLLDRYVDGLRARAVIARAAGPGA